FVGLAQDPLTLGVQFFLTGFQPGFQPADLFFVTGDLLTFFFDGDPVLLQRRDHIFKGFVLLADLFSGPLYDGIGKSQFGGNSESVALSGYTDKKTVSGAQSLHIEFTAGVFHAGSGERVYLQFTVVSGRHGADASLVEIGEN